VIENFRQYTDIETTKKETIRQRFNAKLASIGFYQVFQWIA
jgi:hypothetical protein|tara:strand:+ start:5890 stop:6012 length:123 start_codon:yes stop_codon:yes gene_type:complete